MKRAFLIFSFIFLSFGTSVIAQKQIEPQIERDPVLESDAKHNLEVSRQYFRLKKAYKAVLMRFEETYAAYPEFSKMDEFLYMAGMSSFYLSENKGKQKIDTKVEGDIARYAPKRLREEAVAYLSMLIEKYPQSQFRSDAAKTLKMIEAKK